MESSLVAMSQHCLSIRTEKTTKESEISSADLTYSHLHQQMHISTLSTTQTRGLCQLLK